MGKLGPVLQAVLITVASMAAWEFVVRPAISNALNKDPQQ